MLLSRLPVLLVPQQPQLVLLDAQPMDFTLLTQLVLLVELEHFHASTHPTQQPVIPDTICQD